MSLTDGLSDALRARNRVEQRWLGDMTTMGVGGNATVIELVDEQDLPEIQQLSHRWLGSGANVVIGEGFSEYIVHLAEPFNYCDIEMLPNNAALCMLARLTI